MHFAVYTVILSNFPTIMPSDYGVDTQSYMTVNVYSWQYFVCCLWRFGSVTVELGTTGRSHFTWSVARTK